MKGKLENNFRRENNLFGIRRRSRNGSYILLVTDPDAAEDGSSIAALWYSCFVLEKRFFFFFFFRGLVDRVFSALKTIIDVMSIDEFKMMYWKSSLA